MKAVQSAGKTLAQVGALPLRLSPAGDLEVLLVTTRTTKRWTVPKGWRMKGRKGHEAAAIEAWEEAGVQGAGKRRSVGRYLYWKRLDRTFALCRVKLYPIIVKKERKTWPEQAERRRMWLKVSDAADLVEEPGLRKVLTSLRT